MGFESKHKERDLQLPDQRKTILNNALRDLTDDPYVEAIYEGGSLARGDFDNYSDIDLHVIVAPHMKMKLYRGKTFTGQEMGKCIIF